MSEDNKPCECGNPECESQSWEDGVNDLFDRAFDSIGELVDRDETEKPIALLVFALTEKGQLVIESAGVGPGALTDMILSEACLQVSDHLQNRAMNTPGYKEMMDQMETFEKSSKA